MLFRSGILRPLASLLLVFSLTGLAFADTIRLKDGSIIKGRIISYKGGKFVIAMGEGSRRRELTFTAAEIESIVFDTATGSPTTTTTSYEKPRTIPDTTVVTSDPVIRDDPEVTKPTPIGEKMKPIAWNIKVLADNTNNGWTNTGWVVKKGQRIRITGQGNVNLGKGQTTSASGNPDLNDDKKLLKNVATGALIAVIGDDNNDFIYIGAEREFTATRDGALFLGINEGFLDDNTGSFNVKIEIIPDDGN